MNAIRAERVVDATRRRFPLQKKIGAGLMPSETPVSSDYIKLAPRQVAGVGQVAKGILAGHELVVLDLRIYLGAQNPHDSILIDGLPPLDMIIRGGVQGDTATPAIVVNSLTKISDLQPGLRTMLDLPPMGALVNPAEEDRSVMLKTFQ